MPRRSAGGREGAGEEGREGEGAARGVEVVGGEGDLKVFLFEWGGSSDFVEISLSLAGAFGEVGNGFLVMEPLLSLSPCFFGLDGCDCGG